MNDQINVLIAEKVMAWTKVAPHIYQSPEGQLYTTDWPAMDLFQLPDTGEFDVSYGDIKGFEPETDISASWQVVLKVSEKGGLYELSLTSGLALADFRGDDRRYRVIVPFSEVADDRTLAQCRAICLAALKTAGIEVTK